MLGEFTGVKPDGISMNVFLSYQATVSQLKGVPCLTAVKLLYW